MIHLCECQCITSASVRRTHEEKARKISFSYLLTILRAIEYLYVLGKVIFGPEQKWNKVLFSSLTLRDYHIFRACKGIVLIHSHLLTTYGWQNTRLWSFVEKCVRLRQVNRKRESEGKDSIFSALCYSTFERIKRISHHKSSNRFNMSGNDAIGEWLQEFLPFGRHACFFEEAWNE